MIATLLPVFIFILAGYFIKKFKVIDDAFWEPAERLTYFVFLPSLLLLKTATTDLSSLPVNTITLLMIAGAVLNTAVLFLTRPILGMEGPTFTSVVQGAIRPNTYIGLAAAMTIAGEDGLAFFAVCLAVNIPVVNLLSVAALVRYGSLSQSEGTLLYTGKSIIGNPLIVACIGGGLLNVLGVGLPEIAGSFLELLSLAALPLALLAVGAGLNFEAARMNIRALSIAAILKLVFLPGVFFLASYALGVDGQSTVLLVVFAALPTSAASYILANQMGGDAPVMAGIITGSTVLAMVSLPAILMALG